MDTDFLFFWPIFCNNESLEIFIIGFNLQSNLLMVKADTVFHADDTVPRSSATDGGRCVNQHSSPELCCQLSIILQINSLPV